ncbi:response regulator [Synechococcales cyanobacterium C]|uniref:Response regulator n=1 Tax=Petrachloros mirabilis ULC683 TaxID=2781853 RepID=A0A8K2A8S3_9CYAN|nr:response regulator [Petrachloros mirabilis]NCJ07494.1 response regulator [Petrachloros mirabilis ULC683]
MTRILIVDDQRTIRECLRAMLEPDPELVVVGTAGDGHTALEQVELLQPNVVLIDMEMPGLDGVQATELICQRFPEVKILVLSMHDSDEYVAKALQAGATGYLLKNTPAQDLREAIRFVERGYAQIAPQLFDKVFSIPTVSREPLPSYSPLPTAMASHPRVAPLSNGQGFVDQVPKALQPAEPPSPQPATVTPRHWKGYLGLGVGSMAAIWLLSLAYLGATAPAYRSQWTITLPVASSSARVDLPGIGQATAESSSPYGNRMSDPRENYKDLMLTEEVRSAAAARLQMPLADFGSPRVQVLDNTTLMRIEMSGETPQEAQDKAFVLHEAFENRLEQLRQEEVAQQNRALEASLAGSREKLEEARQKLTAFQAQAGLDSVEQLRDLSVNIEGLRRQRSEVEAQWQQTKAQAQQLSQELGLTAPEAADAFALQADATFQQHLANYSRASSELVRLSANYQSDFPEVVDRREEQQAAQSALLSRGQTVLGRSVSPSVLQQMNLMAGESTGGARATLFQELVSLQNRERGLGEQSQALVQQVSELEGMLKTLAPQKAELQALERDVQIAEAVFSSTLTRLDLGQVNVSASYPTVSIMTQPSMPEAPSAPKTKLVLLGATLGSLLTGLGAFSLWRRDRTFTPTVVTGVPQLPAAAPILKPNLFLDQS